MYVVRGIAVVIVTLSLVACGGPDAVPPGTAASGTATATATATAVPPVPSDSPSETPSDSPSPPSEPTPTPTETEPETPPSGPPVLGPNASGRELTLADVFHYEGQWEEARYDIADRREVRGIGVLLPYCGEYGAAELELRLGRHFRRVTMSVGQANNSPSSDDRVVVEIIANGRQRDSRRIPFDRVQGFSVDIADVNALKLRFWIDTEPKCSGEDVLAVVEKLTVHA